MVYHQRMRGGSISKRVPIVAFRELPVALSLLRLLVIPWLVRLAYLNRRVTWCATLAALMSVDLADGIIARRTGDARTICRQRRLDGLADAILFAVAPPCAYRLRPRLVREERVAIGLLLAAQGASLAACLLRFRRLPRYRSFAYKWSAGSLGFALAGRLAGGLPALAFRPAMALLTLAHLEALAITLSLDAFRQPVASVWAVRRSLKRDDGR
jgi:phosphatidylglycerophosphate synthase